MLPERLGSAREFRLYAGRRGGEALVYRDLRGGTNPELAAPHALDHGYEVTVSLSLFSANIWPVFG